jgi:hypothetical protein
MVVEGAGSSSCDVLFKQDEVQIVPERFAEALVTVGKGLGFARQEVTSAFIPGDQGLSHIYHRHADSASAALLREAFSGG